MQSWSVSVYSGCHCWHGYTFGISREKICPVRIDKGVKPIHSSAQQHHVLFCSITQISDNECEYHDCVALTLESNVWECFRRLFDSNSDASLLRRCVFASLVSVCQFHDAKLRWCSTYQWNHSQSPIPSWVSTCIDKAKKFISGQLIPSTASLPYPSVSSLVLPSKSRVCRESSGQWATSWVSWVSWVKLASSVTARRHPPARNHLDPRLKQAPSPEAKDGSRKRSANQIRYYSI